MQTKEIMTKSPFTIKHDGTVLQALTIMREKGIRHLPVVDDEARVIGMLSDRDIQRAIKIERKSPHIQKLVIDDHETVNAYMSWPVFVVHENTSVQSVIEEFIKQKVSAFVVENQMGQLIGIITTHDVLKHYLYEISV